ARLETEEVPLRPRRREHVPNGNPDPREDLRDLIDEGDVDVALRVLDRLGGLRRLDGRGSEHTTAGDCSVHGRELLHDLLVLACDNLGNPVYRMLPVARIDPLRAVAEPEVGAALEPSKPLNLGPTDLFGHPRINGAFVDDCRAELRIDQ